MVSKLIMLLGLLVGAFLTFMCVNENKTALSLKYNQIAQNDATLQTVTPTAVDTTKVKEEESAPEPEPPTTVELDEPKFLYSLKDGSKLSARFASKDKVPALEEFILSYCPADSCTQDLSFDDNIKDAKWQKHILTIAKFLKDKNAKNALISMEGDKLKIEGEFLLDDDLSKLNENLSFFDNSNYKIENMAKVVPKAKVVVEEPKATPEKPKENSVAEVQDEIKTLLKANPVYFKLNSSVITKKGKETLNRVIALLKGLNNIKLRVEGHTDSIGKASYNKMLSQKRANSVKNYLIKNGDFRGTITAIGYGEELPISSNPRDKINRRVEIYLERGE